MLYTALQSWQWWHRAESFCLGKIMLMFCKLLTTDDEESVEIELKYWACRSWLEHSRDGFKSFLTLLSPRSRQRGAAECSSWPPPLQITKLHCLPEPCTGTVWCSYPATFKSNNKDLIYVDYIKDILNLSLLVYELYSTALFALCVQLYIVVWKMLKSYIIYAT